MPSIDVGKKMKSRAFNIRSPGDLTAVAKKIEKMVATKSSAEVRSNIIDSAYFIRDHVARQAPKKTYENIIMGLPLEKYENKNSGFDVKLNSSMSNEFILKVSTANFSRGTYKNYNPAMGLLVSNYGRDAIQTSINNKIPIPDTKGESDSKTPYNHPIYGTGYNNMYANKKVIFTTHVKAVSPSYWIESAVQEASGKANNILAGAKDYAKRKTTNMFWA